MSSYFLEGPPAKANAGGKKRRKVNAAGKKTDFSRLGQKGPKSRGGKARYPESSRSCRSIRQMKEKGRAGDGKKGYARQKKEKTNSNQTQPLPQNFTDPIKKKSLLAEGKKKRGSYRVQNKHQKGGKVLIAELNRLKKKSDLKEEKRRTIFRTRKHRKTSIIICGQSSPLAKWKKGKLVRGIRQGQENRTTSTTICTMKGGRPCNVQGKGETQKKRRAQSETLVVDGSPRGPVLKKKKTGWKSFPAEKEAQTGGPAFYSGDEEWARRGQEKGRGEKKFLHRGGKEGIPIVNCPRGEERGFYTKKWSAKRLHKKRDNSTKNKRGCQAQKDDNTQKKKNFVWRGRL